MDLFIDTADKEKTIVCLKKSGKEIGSAVIKNNFDQAEKLLPQIDRLLDENQLGKQDLKNIYVNSRGDSFTSLRVGIITANALAFGLGIPVKDFENDSIAKENIEMVKPKYSMEPKITIKKSD